MVEGVSPSTLLLLPFSPKPRQQSLTFHRDSLPLLLDMDLITSQIAQLQEQGRLQAASIAELTSTVSSLSSNNEVQASIIARLSSDNESKSRSIKQLEETVFPNGCWIWEKGEKLGGEEGEEGATEGRWVCSWSKVRAPRFSERSRQHR